jgi:hypothetical protein
MRLGRVLLLWAMLLPLAVFCGSALLLGFHSGPDPQLTAGFGEGTCRKCHNSYALNQGRTVGGVFQILGVPKVYDPGMTYPLRVVIGQPGQSRWGFELSVRFSASGQQAGQLVPLNSLTQVKESAGIQYIEHTAAGTREGTNDGPVEFEFNWIAPAPATEAVLFNASGNASDEDGSPQGDYIYTAGAYSGVSGQAASQAAPTSRRAETKGPVRLSETSKVINLPAPVDLKRGSMEILIQHRFLQSLADVRPGNAFGIDLGANINLGFNYALTDRISFGVSRARFDQIVTLAGTYEIRTRKGSFWKMSLNGGVEGTQNLEGHYSPFLQLTSSFDYKFLRLYFVPTLVFNSRNFELPQAELQAINPQANQTFSLGVGADIALNRKFSLLGEVVPRVAGFGGFYQNDFPSVSTGIAIRSWGHVFTILASSSREFTPAHYAVNAGQHNLSLGFNIYRRIR